VNLPLKLNPRRDPHKPTRFSHAIHLSEAVGYDEYPERTKRMRERLVAKLHFLIIAHPTLASFTPHRENDGMEGGKKVTYVSVHDTGGETTPPILSPSSCQIVEHGLTYIPAVHL
jgi:hypothetical protein